MINAIQFSPTVQEISSQAPYQEALLPRVRRG